MNKEDKIVMWVGLGFAALFWIGVILTGNFSVAFFGRL